MSEYHTLWVVRKVLSCSQSTSIKVDSIQLWNKGLNIKTLVCTWPKLLTQIGQIDFVTKREQTNLFLVFGVPTHIKGKLMQCLLLISLMKNRAKILYLWAESFPVILSSIYSRLTNILKVEEEKWRLIFHSGSNSRRSLWIIGRPNWCSYAQIASWLPNSQAQPIHIYIVLYFPCISWHKKNENNV